MRMGHWRQDWKKVKELVLGLVKETTLGRGKSKCKGLEMGLSLVCLRSSGVEYTGRGEQPLRAGSQRAF